MFKIFWFSEESLGALEGEKIVRSFCSNSLRLFVCPIQNGEERTYQSLLFYFFYSPFFLGFSISSLKTPLVVILYAFDIRKSNTFSKIFEFDHKDLT